MVRKLRSISFYFLLTVLVSCQESPVLQDVKKLNYPSASGMEYLDGKVYVMGDDANYLLILDSTLAIIDSIPFFHYSEKRIPKSVKPDLEAMTILPGRKLLLAGSGSVVPYRNKAWIVDTRTRSKDSIILDTFYKRLEYQGISQLNIEGMTTIPGALVLSNRGNKSFPKNHLLFTAKSFWEQQAHVPIHSVLIGFNTDSLSFKGVSGLAYVSRNDKLLLTVSTEDTRNNVDDGTIGKSYLWIVKNISAKTRWKAINPDKIIDLETIDSSFKSQKIESLCVLRQTRRFLYLLIAADNDDGSSTIFKLVIPND